MISRLRLGFCVAMFLLISVATHSSVTSQDAPVKAKKVPPMTRSELLKIFADEFVPIVPGEKNFPARFSMGSDRADHEKPTHEVTIKQPFAIAKYEVPQNLWETVMGDNPSKWKGGRNSVEMMSWNEAREFCRKATELMRAEKLLSEHEIIRLPSEAEWEYCCRAGTTTAYSFGDSATQEGDVGNKATRLNEFGWHTGNAAGNDPPVGAKKPNPWNLYDVHGYLWEFVDDEWHDNYNGAPSDGTSWSGPAPKRIVVRGGSWKDHHSKLTSSARRGVSVEDKDDAIGLRCVKAKVQ